MDALLTELKSLNQRIDFHQHRLLPVFSKSSAHLYSRTYFSLRISELVHPLRGVCGEIPVVDVLGYQVGGVLLPRECHDIFGEIAESTLTESKSDQQPKVVGLLNRRN